MSAKIHTLSTLSSKSKNVSHQQLSNKAKALIPKFKKDDAWIENVNHFKSISQSLTDPNDLMLCPIYKDSKNPDLRVNGRSKKWSRNPKDGYTEKQLYTWDDWEKINHDHDDNDLGMLIRGEVGVFDWDTQEGYDWFMSSFITEPEDYNIYTSAEKHTGGHIIFKIDERTKSIFDKITNHRHWLSKPTDAHLTWDIDLKKEASTTSPVVVKLPSALERSKKKWVSKCETLNTLPPAFLDYMDSHIYICPKQVVNQSNSRFIIELLKLIPKNTTAEDFSGKDFNRIVMECLKQGVSEVEFYDWSKDLDISKSFPNHKQYIANQWDYSLKHTELCGSSIDTTLRVVRNLAGPRFDKYLTTYIYQCRTKTFQRNFIRIIDWFYRDDIQKKMTAIMRYMNKYFTFTTGMMKNLTYFREYDDADKLDSVKYYQDAGSFDSATDVKIVINEEGDKMPVGKYWRSQADNSFHKVINRPFGISKRIFSQDLNTFTGYKMVYEPNYSNPECDHYGNLIDKHFTEIICANNLEVINWMRKYFYDMIFLGKRPKVAVFCCSTAMGSGKSLFVSPFAKYVVGENQSRVIQNFAKMCKDTFTDYYDDATFVILEEIPKYDQAKYSEMYEEFKELITGDRQSSRKFQQAPTQIENNSTWWVNSNHPQGLQPEIATRRFICLEVSPEKVGDIKYFELLAEAVHQQDAWTNWFHRFIIDKKDEFKHCIIEPVKKHIPMTPLKKRILTRRIDNFTLFFKYLIYETEYYDPDAEDPLNRVRNKKIMVKTLYENYELWKTSKNISNDWCNDLLKFSKKLNQHFYMEELELTTMTAEDIAKMKKKQKTYLEPSRNSRGKYVVFSDEFLALLDGLIGELEEQPQQLQYVDEAEVLGEDDIPQELKELATSSSNQWDDY